MLLHAASMWTGFDRASANLCQISKLLSAGWNYGQRPCSPCLLRASVHRLQMSLVAAKSKPTQLKPFTKHQDMPNLRQQHWPR